jgi:hypothetical protein
MKRKKINILVGLTAVLMVTSTLSCKKVDDFGNLNTDPNAATVPVTGALFTSVISNMHALAFGPAAPANTPGLNADVAGLYCQYYSETQYTDVSIFSKESLNWDDYFAANVFAQPTPNQYTQNGMLFDLQTVIKANTDAKTKASVVAYGSNANQIAVARILKAYIFSTITDLWGDMPYSNTLVGDNGQVVYTKQKDIYTDLFKELNEAVAQFDGGANVSGDIFLGGDPASWKKFANSIHALLALHLSKIDPTTGKAEFAKALAGGLIDKDLVMNYPGGNFFNPIYRYYDITKRFDYAVSQTMTDWLTQHSDPRGQANIYATTSVGFPFGLARNAAVAFANANTNYAKVMAGQGTSPTASFPILGVGEMLLARAEAAQRGWTAEDPVALYAQGIRAAWDLWTPKGSDAASQAEAANFGNTQYTAYLANTDITLSSGDPLTKICQQEWVTHYPNGVRGWTLWRRTGVPALVGGPAAVTANKAIPRRFAYGPNEYSTNSANVAPVATQYTVAGDADSQLARMWWDAQ